MRRIMSGVLALSIVTVFHHSVTAADVAMSDSSRDGEAEAPSTFPEIRPEASITGGLRLVDRSGSGQAAEYEYLHDSIVFGGHAQLFSYPHRFHLDFDFNNRKDYLGDLWYAYKEIVFFRITNRTVFHNLDSIALIDLDTATGSPGVDVRDAGRGYGTKTGITDGFLKLKAPNFPLHFYIDTRLRQKDGTMQQRNYGGSGWFNPPQVRISQKRDVDWETRNIIIGANSHLGPVEVDFSHGEKRLDVGSDRVLFDNYSQAGFGPPPGMRPAGQWPHNLVPELKSSSNTLKLHTSYTGRIVASATFSTIDRENRYSGTDADSLIGAGNVAWIASEKLAFFVRYRYTDLDIDNPASITISDRTNPLNTYGDPDVRPSISSRTNRVSVTGVYRPAPILTLRAKYTYDDIRRSKADEWDLPDSTQKNIGSLSADVRVKKGLKLKAAYTYKDIQDPAHNTDPDDSNEGKLSITWTPLQRVNTSLSYSITKEDRDYLHFTGFNGAEKRDVKRERLLGSVTVLARNDLTCTASYAYINNKAKQDIVYHDTIGDPYVDPSVPYEDTAHSFAVDISYIPWEDISLNAGVSHTRGSGNFNVADPNLTQPVSVDSFSRLKIKETVFSASGEYQVTSGFSTGLQYRFSDYSDVLDNPHDDTADGSAHIVVLTVSKKW
jgi:predicted porin